MEYLDTLKKLINGEIVCAMQYKLAGESLVGSDNFSYIQEHCLDHFDEEMEHASILIAALMQRGETPDLNLSSVIGNANPQTIEMTSNDTSAVAKFFADAEEAAIKAYLDFHKMIEDVDADLDDVIIGIIEDERDHKLDFNRLSSIEKADVSDEEDEEHTEKSEEKESEEDDEKSEEDTEEKEEADEDDDSDDDMIKKGYHESNKLTYKESLKKFIENLDKNSRY